MIDKDIDVYSLGRRFGWVGAVWLGLMAGGALGQDAAAPATPAVAPTLSTSTITGSVICADTNAPARLAQVILRSTTPSNAGAEMVKGLEEFQGMMNGGDSKKTLTKEQETDQKRQTAELARTASMMADAGHTVPVGLDGTYRFTNVPPGTYQIRATLFGACSPPSRLAVYTSQQTKRS